MQETTLKSIDTEAMIKIYSGEEKTEYEVTDIFGNIQERKEVDPEFIPGVINKYARKYKTQFKYDSTIQD